MTLLKDLIEIPEHVQKGDFVLRLTEGVERSDATLRDYVVTPELKACFAQALAFVRSAIEGRTSKATYLHGSFGSGKSHFMAVLHLILRGDPAARAIPELADVIIANNEWLAGKKFLLAPYHMIGAQSVESGVLGGYVDFIRRTHPEAPLPGVYLAENMFADAQRLRQKMGDAGFFAALNEGRASNSGWGNLEATWDADKFEEAIDAPPGAEARSQLIDALVKHFYGSYQQQVGGQTEAFLDLDKGLAVISRHAQSLGYDGVIFFLDELILWLASRAADIDFVHREGQKLVKLVEAQTSDRPVPLVSFVARQRDLRELIGDSVPGAQQVNFGDALKHWEGRFDRINLEDRNLPAIAEKRVLRPRSEAARAELDAAFAKTAATREAVLNVLLTHAGDRAMFRRVYPFSPALVQTLIAVSSVLQRERTALKVMMQLLVDQRETLQVGDLVPVGDLFDVIAHGDEAFSPEIAIHFDNAKRLYHQKLLPLLEQQWGRREELDALAWDDVRRAGFRNDDRLIKTLLLAALVPEVESFREMTAERLAALNHGTIKTPIAGREGQEVLARCRRWSAEVGEIRIGPEANPTISLQLSGVDTEAILAKARGEDSFGNRIRRVRQMLFEELGVGGEGEFEQTHEFLWRHTRRKCQVLFRNIRELPSGSLANDDEHWKLVIDYPFDAAGHGPRDDLSKLQAFQQEHSGGAKTLAWVPSFLSDAALKELGTLVILEHILSGERLNQYASDLSAPDRHSARIVLQNRCDQLRSRVKLHLETAYGLQAATHLDSVNQAQELEPADHFVSLQPGVLLRPPVAPSLKVAMESLLDQALSQEFPAAPAFEVEIKPSQVKKVLEPILAAAQGDGRTAVDKNLRPFVRGIANPLRLGEMQVDGTHFVLGQHWKNHFHKKIAELGGAPTVAQLCRWIDEPQPMGLPAEVQQLILLTVAAQTNRSFFLHGGPYEAGWGNIPAACELRDEILPEEAAWKRAVELAGSIFGLAPSPLRNAANVKNLSAQVKTKATEHRPDCQTYVERLGARLQALGLQPDQADRFRTAQATLVLLTALAQSEEGTIVEKLSRAEVQTSAAAMGTCFKSAAGFAAALQSTNWETLEIIPSYKHRAGEASAIFDALRTALQSDEHVEPLEPALRLAQQQALRLIKDNAAPTNPPPGPQDPPEGAPGRRTVRHGAKENLTSQQAKEEVLRLEREQQPGETCRINLSWIVETGGER